MPIETIRLESLVQGDADSINDWPPYPQELIDLDYALRPGGWLDQFPESTRTHRYAIKDGDLLVGFTILTNIRNADAEFYIAVHPDHLGKGIGTAATRQTVLIGFHRLGLSRIYLKVRLWHKRAIQTYKNVGFTMCGTSEEVIHGKHVQFLTMEIRQSQEPL